MQLTLFQPRWWTPADQAVCDSFHAEDARDDNPPIGDMEDPAVADAWEAWAESLHPRAAQYRCRTCAHWDSADGNAGDCHGPELRCGETTGGNGCEQFWPRG